MMMGKNDRRGYYRNNAFETAGESEGPGSLGRIDAEITASEDSSALTRKCNINSDKTDAFCVPMQFLSPSNLSRPERKDLVHKLTSDLEQLRILQMKVGVQRTNGVTVSSSSDILSCKNGLNWPRVENFRKSPVNNKAREWNRGTSGRFVSAEKLASTKSNANIMLMKQCETLLKRLMSHQYGWVFNTPVDVVKLNIPDYYTVIKHPMDLGTIKGKIASSAYSCPVEFLADVRLTFSNAMIYNPPDNDVHKMADTLRKSFEARWKAIEKKLPVSKPQLIPQKYGPRANVETTKAVPQAKKRKIETMRQEILTAPVKPVMTDQEKHSLSRILESMLREMPVHIIDFLREHSSNGRENGEYEIKIDSDDLSVDTLFTLRKLLDEYLEEKQKNQASAEPCEIELLNESALSNSSMQHGKDNDLADEEIVIGGNEPSISSYSLVEIEKDTGIKSSKCISPGRSSDSGSSSSESESDDVKASSPIKAPKMEKTVEINENYHFLEELEMLWAAPAKHLPSAVYETSPDHSQDGLGSFKFGGSDPLEQLGLYTKEDDEEEDVEPPSVPNPLNDVEEGESD